jgi:transposase
MKQQTSCATETHNKSSNIINFTGKTIHVGIDVHLKDWQIATVNETVVLGNHRMEGKVENVVNHLQKRFPGATFKCVYESCAWGFELQRQLIARGMECIVVNAADVSGSDKERKRKTDKVDAVKLARYHAAGLLQGIHIPNEELQKQRNLVRYRTKLIRDLNRSKNRLKGLLKYQGIETPKQFSRASWSRNFMSWIEQEAQKDIVLKDTLLLMLEQVKLLRQLLLEVEKKLRILMNSEKYSDSIKLLMSVPGIGRTIATLWLLEIGDIRRFENIDRLNAYVGFCPDTNSSGEIQHDRGISSRKHNQLRASLIQAAWQAIRTDPVMLETYQQLIKRMKGTQAIVRIARKLVRRIRAIQLNATFYLKGVIG